MAHREALHRGEPAQSHQQVAESQLVVDVLSILIVTKIWFAIIVLVWLAIHLGTTWFFLYKGYSLWKNHADAETVLSGKIVDTFMNILTVKLFARKNYEAEYLRHFQNDEIQKASRALRQTEIMRLILSFNGGTLIFTVLFALIYGWKHHWGSDVVEQNQRSDNVCG